MRNARTSRNIVEPDAPMAAQRRRRSAICCASARCWDWRSALDRTTTSSICLLTWLPSYLSSALHIDLLHSFLYTGVPWLFARLTDLAGGWLADFLIHRGWDASRVRKTVIVCGTAFGLGILGAAHAHTATRALIWISISIGGLAAAAPVGWSIPSMIAPRGSVGTVGGIVNFSNQISGIAAPIITGYVVAATHSFAWAFGIAAHLFADRHRQLHLPAGQDRAESHVQ